MIEYPQAPGLSSEAWTLMIRTIPYAVAQQKRIDGSVQSGMHPNNFLWQPGADFHTRGGRAIPRK